MASVTEAGGGALSGSTILTPPPQRQGTSSSSPTTAAKTDSSQINKPEFYWMVKPCFLYKEEYKDCKSFKAKFHQYFIHGKSSECEHWKEDYDNCVLWEEKNNLDGLKKVIESEKTRVRTRLRSHYSNDVWEHRASPPSDWNKELPESIKKEYSNSFLKTKAEELKNGTEKLGNIGRSSTAEGLGSRDDDEGSSCSIM